MYRIFIAATAIVALLAGISFAHGQKQTERYIPLGQSPGLSGKYTHIGTVEAADAKTRTITVASTDRRYAVTVTERTRIWLDRSRLKLTMLAGSFADLKLGGRIEVKPEGTEQGSFAEWIKVEITEPGGSEAPHR